MIYILLGYLGTTFATLLIRGAHRFLLIKDLASRFYKIDIDAMKNENDNIEYFNLKRLDYKSFIPIYNLFKSIQSIVEYYKDYDIICDDLEDMGIIYSMANFEIYEYRKKPNIINLFRVLRKGRERLMRANYFEGIDEEGLVEAQAFYEGNDDITILDTMGKFDDMLTSEVVDVIKTNDKDKMFSNFIHDDGKKIITATSKNDIQGVINLSLQERIELLKRMEEELLSHVKEKGKQKSIGQKK